MDYYIKLLDPNQSMASIIISPIILMIFIIIIEIKYYQFKITKIINLYFPKTNYIVCTMFSKTFSW